MEKILFNYYPADIKKTKPIGIVNLKQLINAIENPKPEIKHIFEQIRLAEISGNQKLKSDLKTKLYYFTPCIIIGSGNERQYKNIIKWNGVVMLDFDHLQPEYCKEFKQVLFDNYKCIIATWLSASQHGLRVLIKIPEAKSVTEFKQYWEAIRKEFDKYHGFDTATKNCILPMFMSYDKDILYRNDFETWNKKHIEIIKPIVKQYIIQDKSNHIESICNIAVNKIISNGHPQLRAISFALGGYISAGYIDENTANNMINKMIEGNNYLSQKHEVYKKTAKTMINQGMLNPLYLKNE